MADIKKGDVIVTSGLVKFGYIDADGKAAQANFEPMQAKSVHVPPRSSKNNKKIMAAFQFPFPQKVIYLGKLHKKTGYYHDAEVSGSGYETDVTPPYLEPDKTHTVLAVTEVSGEWYGDPFYCLPEQIIQD